MLGLRANIAQAGSLEKTASRAVGFVHDHFSGLERGIGKIALNESSQAIQFLFAGRVQLYFTLRK